MVSPRLTINRVVVEGDLGCNLRFEPGLNVVYADPADGGVTRTNRSGKTALIELIQYGLGRRHDLRQRFHFFPILDRLKNLWLEVSANEQTITISRSLQQLGAAASVYSGDLDAETAQKPREIVSVDDLSRLYLRLLNMPEVSVRRASGELDRLTFPVLMRAFILHQDDSFGAVLDKVQPESRRRDIIGFLSGIISLQRFPLEEKLGELQINIEHQEDVYRTVWEFLQQQGISSLQEAEEKLSQAETNVESATAARRSIQESMLQVEAIGQHLDGITNEIRNSLLTTENALSDLDRELIALNQESERLESLAASLRSDLQRSSRLKASTDVLSPVDFTICPRCLLPISTDMRHREDEDRCMLCSRPIRKTSDDLPRAAFEANDLRLQLDEAGSLLADVQQQVAETTLHRQELRTERERLANILNQETEAYVSPAVDRLLAAAEEVSRREAEAAAARALVGQARTLDQIRQSLEAMNDRRTEIDADLAAAIRSSGERLSSLREIYRRILTQVGFPDLREVSIDPHTLLPFINGMLYVHQGAAYRGVAVVAYHVALLELSLQWETYYPRLLVLDSPAVGDLNEETHSALLDYLGGLPERYSPVAETGESNWQVILTTRHMVPTLDPYIRETISSPDRMLLRPRDQWRALTPGHRA